MSSVICKKCGAKVSVEFSYCTHCNAPIIETRPTLSQTNVKKEKPFKGKNELRKPRISRNSSQSLIEWLRSPLVTDRDDQGHKLAHPTRAATITRATRPRSDRSRVSRIDVVDVLKSTLGMVRKAPVIFVPLFVLYVFSGIIASWLLLPLLTPLATTPDPSATLASFWNALPPLLAVFALAGLPAPLVYGMYPSLVEDASREKRMNFADSLRKAGGKYISLLTSKILVTVLTILGLLLFVAPGVIIGVWYYYTDCAIILEDRGALSGMSASKAFARRRKLETLMLILVPFGIFFLGVVIRLGLSILPTGGLTIPLAFNVIFGALAALFGSVLSSYTYLSYAMKTTK